MFHFTSHKVALFNFTTERSRPITFPSLISLPFLIGLAAGTIIGLFSGLPQMLFTTIGLATAFDSETTFLRVFWYSSRFVFIAAILATDILAAALLPFLSAIRGFLFACSVAAVIHPMTYSSFAITFLSLGLPALFNFPAFFLAATDAYFLSRSLLAHERSSCFRDIPIARHLFFILILCTSDAIYIRFLLPFFRGFF